MPSLRARFVNLASPLLGIKRFFSEPDKIEDRIAALRRKPTIMPRAALRKQFDIVEDDSRGYKVVTMTPRGVDAVDGPHLLYLHGGGYVMDIAAVHWDSTARLCRDLGASATVPLYLLAPEHKAADVLDAMRALYDDVAARYGAESVTVMGDSAGGGMALELAQMIREDGGELPASLVLFSPWLDATADAPGQRDIEPHDRMLAVSGLEACGEMYRGNLAADHPKVSPLFGPLKGLPPMAIFSGTSDILLVDGRCLNKKLTALGSRTHVYREYPGMFHVWMLLPVPEGRQALDETADFIRQHARASA